jgi:hypothetical protein
MQDKGIQFQNGLAWLAGLRTGSFWTCLRLSKVHPGKFSDWNSKCPLCETEQAEDIEHLILRCSKWNKDRDLMLEAIKKDWERYEPSRQPVIDRATILGGVNEHGDTLMPLWLEGCKREGANQTEIIIVPAYLHVVRFLDKIGERRRLEILKMQKLKLRQELSNEAHPDREVDSEGSENDLNFQEEDEWLEDLEDI